MPASSKRSKTSRFPVARIKKIMQTDEEVGKLASATPVMISKSLECFLQMMVDKSCEQARARGSKKIAAHHVKHAVLKEETLDWLLSTVDKIPEPAIESIGAGEGDAAAAAGPSKPRKSASSATGVDGASGSGSGTGAKRGRKPKAAAVPHIATSLAQGGEGGEMSISTSPAFGRSPIPRKTSYGYGNGNGNGGGSDSKPFAGRGDAAAVKQERADGEWESINPTPRSMINLLNPDPGAGVSGGASSGGPRFPGMGVGTGMGREVKQEDERERDTKPSLDRDFDMDSPAPTTATSIGAPGTGTTGPSEQKGMFDDYDDEDDY